MVLRQLVVVDAVDDRQVRAVGGRRDDDALGAGRQMRGGLVARGEDAGAFQRDVDAEFAMRQLRGIAHRRHLDRAAADIDGVAFDRHLVREAAVHAVEAKQVGVRLDRAEIVDRDDLDVGAAGIR